MLKMQAQLLMMIYHGHKEADKQKEQIKLQRSKRIHTEFSFREYEDEGLSESEVSTAFKTVEKIFVRNVEN